MSWHYLQGEGEVSSEDISWDGDAFVPSKSRTTLGGYCLPDNATESSPASLSGMTCEPSMASPGGAASISSLGASPARTYPAPAKGQDSMAPDLDCGPRWPGSLARYDPDTRLWKTAQCSLFGGLEEFSETWPRWGMMRDGESFPLPTPAHLIGENVSGLWPTPVKYDATPGGPGNHYQGLGWMARQNMFPTPTKQERASSRPYDPSAPSLSGRSLSTFARTYPTPRANDAEKRGNIDPMNPRNGLPGAVRKDAENGGQLNPTWVEWLMGWTLGWTDLRPLAMDRFRQWCVLHGIS